MFQRPSNALRTCFPTGFQRGSNGLPTAFAPTPILTYRPGLEPLALRVSFRRAFMGGRGNVLDGDCGHRRPPSTLSLTQLLARLTPARAGGSLHERLSTRVEISRARARRGTPGILAGFEVDTGVGQK